MELKKGVPFSSGDDRHLAIGDRQKKGAACAAPLSV